MTPECLHYNSLGESHRGDCPMLSGAGGKNTASPAAGAAEAEMSLPPGKTCGDCVHIRRCTIFGFTPAATETMCSFHPSRFR